MLYLHRLLHMSTFSRMALTATLALSASLWLVGSRSVRAEISEMADALTAPRVELPPDSTLRSTSQPVVQSNSNTFDPEPNAPPRRTGGSGTR